MDELFVRLLLIELNNVEGMEAVYDRKNERILILPKYTDLFTPIYVDFENGEYLFRYATKDRPIKQKVQHIMDKVAVITKAWKHSTPMCVENFQKLTEWNGVVLAARDDGDHGLHLVTWRYDNDHQSVDDGNYTTSISGAIWDFIGRSGLVPKERLFNDEQIAVIRSALHFALLNDCNLYPSTEKIIDSILLALEMSDDPN